jgi:uncharacterized membrane protein HdeD (DUF308 family)
MDSDEKAYLGNPVESGSDKASRALLGVAGAVGCLAGVYVLHSPTATIDVPIAVSGGLLVICGLIAIGFAILSAFDR